MERNLKEIDWTSVTKSGPFHCLCKWSTISNPVIECTSSSQLTQIMLHARRCQYTVQVMYVQYVTPTVTVEMITKRCMAAL